VARYDLSHPLTAEMSVYPGSRPVQLNQAATVEHDGACVTELDIDTHAGTHIDAPAHTLADGKSLAEFPLSAFSFDALCVDCSGVGAREPIDVDDLPHPSDHDMLLIRTGWSDHWGSDRYRDHPYLTRAAAEWCGAHGYSVGLDTFGPDPTPSVDPGREGSGEPDGLPAHDALFAEDCLILENLRGLAAVPDTLQLTALPLALDAEASPVRAVATEP